MADGTTQNPVANSNALNRILVTTAPRAAGDCYDEALFRGIVKRLTFTIQESDLDGPIINQVAPPSDLSAIWIPTDSSAGYAAGVNHIWNGAAWVPVVTQVAISGDTNNAIFLDPSGGLKVNMPARLRTETVLSGPTPTAVTVNWTADQYSLGDETPTVGWLLVTTTPAGPLCAVEISRTSTSWTANVLGLAAGEQITMVLEFNQPFSKGD